MSGFELLLKPTKPKLEWTCQGEIAIDSRTLLERLVAELQLDGSRSIIDCFPPARGHLAQGPYRPPSLDSVLCTVEAVAEGQL